MAAAEHTQSVDVPLEKFFKVITDYASYPRFVTGMKGSQLVSETADAKRVRFDLELMKRIQYELEISEKLDAAAGTAEVSWKLAGSDFLNANNGGWRLKALGPNKTEAVYRLELDFKFPVPGFILKKLVATSLPGAVRDFAEESKRRG